MRFRNTLAIFYYNLIVSHGGSNDRGKSGEISRGENLLGEIDAANFLFGEIFLAKIIAAKFHSAKIISAKFHSAKIIAAKFHSAKYILRMKLPGFDVRSFLKIFTRRKIGRRK